MSFDPDHLAALSTILRHGSFEAAAAELLVTPSAVSQRIRTLEERVGASLIRRGQPCTATPTGARLAKHAEDITLLEAQLARDLSLDSRPYPAQVRLAANADSLATWFVTALANLPDLLVDLVIDDQDHSADWLRDGTVSAAVTATGRPVQGCDAVPLGTLRYAATASPAYLARWFPGGLSPESLSRAPCLVFSAKDRLQHRWMETNVPASRRMSPPCHVLPSTHAFVDAALAGVGWGMNPWTLVSDHIGAGRLAELRPGALLDVPLSWQVSRIMAPALEPLTQAVRQAATAGLHQPLKSRKE